MGRTEITTEMRRSPKAIRGATDTSEMARSNCSSMNDFWDSLRRRQSKSKWAQRRAFGFFCPLTDFTNQNSN
jgi:hypothetical protein